MNIYKAVLFTLLISLSLAAFGNQAEETLAIPEVTSGPRPAKFAKIAHSGSDRHRPESQFTIVLSSGDSVPQKFGFQKVID